MTHHIRFNSIRVDDNRADFPYSVADGSRPPIGANICVTINGGTLSFSDVPVPDKIAADLAAFATEVVTSRLNQTNQPKE